MSDENGRTTDGVVITESLMDRLMALPETKSGTPSHVWTEEEDKGLIATWRTRGQKNVAKAIGVCVGVCRDRYDKLTGGKQ